MKDKLKNISDELSRPLDISDIFTGVQSGSIPVPERSKRDIMTALFEWCYISIESGWDTKPVLLCLERAIEGLNQIILNRGSALSGETAKAVRTRRIIKGIRDSLADFLKDLQDD